MLAGKFSEQVYYGYWYSPEGDYVRFCLDKSQDNVEGKVTLDLFKGNVCFLNSVTVFVKLCGCLKLSPEHCINYVNGEGCKLMGYIGNMHDTHKNSTTKTHVWK